MRRHGEARIAGMDTLGGLGGRPHQHAGWIENTPFHPSIPAYRPRDHSLPDADVDLEKPMGSLWVANDPVVTVSV